MGKLTVIKNPWASNEQYNDLYWEGMTLRNKDIVNAWLEDCIVETFRFDNCCFDRLETCRTELENGSIYGTHFSNFMIDEGGGFNSVSFKDSSFNNCKMFTAVFDSCNIEGGLIFSNCDFDSVTFLKCNLKDIRFENCTFRHVLFDGCAFSGNYSPLRKQDINQIEFTGCTFTESKIQDSTFFVRTTREGVNSNATGRNCVYFNSLKENDIEIIDCNTAGLDTTGLQQSNIKRTGAELKTPTVRKPIKAVVNGISADDDMSDSEYQDEMNIAAGAVVSPDYTHIGAGGKWAKDSHDGICGIGPPGYSGPGSSGYKPGGHNRSSTPAYGKQPTYNPYKNRNPPRKRPVFIVPHKNKKRAYRFTTSGI